MQANYKVSKNKTNGNFEVFDDNSHVLVFSSSEHKESYDIYRKLKKGSGFDFWTPGFFAPVKHNYNLDTSENDVNIDHDNVEVKNVSVLQSLESS